MELRRELRAGTPSEVVEHLLDQFKGSLEKELAEVDARWKPEAERCREMVRGRAGVRAGARGEA